MTVYHNIRPYSLNSRREIDEIQNNPIRFRRNASVRLCIAMKVHLRWRPITLRWAAALSLFAGVIGHSLVVGSASGQVLESAQNGSSRFEPLEHWKAGVLAGDQASLKALYITTPQTFAITPEGKTSDLANEESDYWSGLRAAGLTDMNVKVLQRTEPRPGFEQLVLRFELTVKTKNGVQRFVIGGLQIWGKPPDGDWGMLATQRTEIAALPAMRLPEPTIPNTQLYPAPEAASEELNAALEDAKKDGKRVLVVFGANWCYDCHVLDEAMRSKNLAALVAANYHVVHINIGDGNSNANLATRFDVPLDKGIPSLAVLDANGKVMTSQKQGEFQSASAIGMSDITQFLEHWKSEAKKSAN
jgi:thioredoxin 1